MSPSFIVKVESSLKVSVVSPATEVSVSVIVNGVAFVPFVLVSAAIGVDQVASWGDAPSEVKVLEDAYAISPFAVRAGIERDQSLLPVRGLAKVPTSSSIVLTFFLKIVSCFTLCPAVPSCPVLLFVIVWGCAKLNAVPSVALPVIV